MGDEGGEVGSWLVWLGCGGCVHEGTGGWGRRVREVERCLLKTKSIPGGMAEVVCEDK